jgi:hypothetical protein
MHSAVLVRLPPVVWLPCPYYRNCYRVTCADMPFHPWAILIYLRELPPSV